MLKKSRRYNLLLPAELEEVRDEFDSMDESEMANRLARLGRAGS